MKRRTFLKSLGCALASVAAFYVPGKPWSVMVPKPPINRQGGWLVPPELTEWLVRAHRDGSSRGPRMPLGGITARWVKGDDTFTLLPLPSPASST